MDEKTKKRLRHIRDANEVNKRHADAVREESVARAKRSRVQVKAEVLENKNIDYRKHMKWMNR